MLINNLINKKWINNKNIYKTKKILDKNIKNLIIIILVKMHLDFQLI